MNNFVSRIFQLVVHNCQSFSVYQSVSNHQSVFTFIKKSVIFWSSVCQWSTACQSLQCSLIGQHTSISHGSLNIHDSLFNNHLPIRECLSISQNSPIRITYLAISHCLSFLIKRIVQVERKSHNTPHLYPKCNTFTELADFENEPPFNSTQLFSSMKSAEVFFANRISCRRTRMNFLSRSSLLHFLSWSLIGFNLTIGQTVDFRNFACKFTKMYSTSLIVILALWKIHSGNDS